MKGLAAVCPFCFPKAEEAETVRTVRWLAVSGARHAGWRHMSQVPVDHPTQVRAGKPLSMWVPLSHDPLLKPTVLPTLTPQLTWFPSSSENSLDTL